jgi:peptide/nickel transport system permease protein
VSAHRGGLPGATPGPPQPPGPTQRRPRLASLVRKGWPLFAILVLLAVGVAAVAGPTIAPKDPNRQNIIARLQPPMTPDRAGVVQFMLGTDGLGRDVLSRLIYGARVSLLVGLTAVLIGGTSASCSAWSPATSAAASTPSSCASPTSSSRSRSSCWRSCSSSCWGRGCSTSSSSSGVGQWVTYARIARAQTLSQREKEYVEAARALGARAGSVLFKTILPNILAPLIVIASFNVASVILSEAALSFLGLGRAPDDPHLGRHARREPRPAAGRPLVARRVPGRRDRPHRAVVQHPRRLAPRLPRPAPARRRLIRKGPP